MARWSAPAASYYVALVKVGRAVRRRCGCWFGRAPRWADVVAVVAGVRRGRQRPSSRKDWGAGRVATPVCGVLL
eukprot:4020244-Lingulodinium_polyedra.AAC.1